ncbi:hypothetical protein AVEN_128600-1 [Araneus ventricosus]|uniref:Transposase Tc1-like domain-containing protein n=1 Tax=Araneus ventricosus TaxID=182803 RepID=A0A4Y2RD13_ARAVE|nr:hypothetical protein AVEN_128600-1 [Araneus ventricosus]
MFPGLLDCYIIHISLGQARFYWFCRACVHEGGRCLLNQHSSSNSEKFPRRRSTTVPQLVADHFVASGRRISATTVRRCLQNTGLYARRPVACVPSTDDKEGPAYVGQENTFPGPDSNELLCSSQTSPDSHWRAIQGVC